MTLTSGRAVSLNAAADLPLALAAPLESAPLTDRNPSSPSFLRNPTVTGSWILRHSQWGGEVRLSGVRSRNRSLTLPGPSRLCLPVCLWGGALGCGVRTAPEPNVLNQPVCHVILWVRNSGVSRAVSELAGRHPVAGALVRRVQDRFSHI